MNGAVVAPVLLVTGALTIAPVALVLVPVFGIRLVFGSDAADAYTVTLTRHWGLLVALVGGLLVYSAFHAELRTPVMTAAAIEKLAVAILFSTALPRRWTITLIAGADAAMALLYLYLLVRF